MPNITALLINVGCTMKETFQNRFGSPKCTMKVHLAEHIVAGLQIILDRGDARSSDENAVIGLVDVDRFHDPFEVVNAIFRTGHQTVTQEVIHSIDVELRGDQLGEGSSAKGSFDNRGDTLGKVRRKCCQHTIYVRMRLGDSGDRVILVVKAEYRFDHMRKGSVADIVQQRGGTDGDPLLVGDRVLVGKLSDDPRSEVKCP